MKKILYVDDEKDLHPVVQSFFPKDQYRLILASDGSEGMQKCRNEDFDLIIVDYKMPKIDGAKFYIQLQDLHESKKATMPPLIFVSGFIDELKSKDLRWVRCEFLNKPFSKEELFEKIQILSSVKPKLAARIDVKRVLNPGELLFSEGEDATSMFYVLKGKLEIHKTLPNGNKVIMGKIESGELVGEMAVLSQEKQIVSVIALDQVELIPIPTGKIKEIVDSQPKWIKIMIENLSRRLKDTIKQIA